MRRNPHKRRLSMACLKDPCPDLHLVLFVRCGGHCWYCGCQLKETSATIDHVLPIKRGGVTTLRNVVLACTHCNTSKADKTLEEFRVSVGAEKFWGEEKGLICGTA